MVDKEIREIIKEIDAKIKLDAMFDQWHDIMKLMPKDVPKGFRDNHHLLGGI